MIDAEFLVHQLYESVSSGNPSDMKHAISEFLEAIQQGSVFVVNEEPSAFPYELTEEGLTILSEEELSLDEDDDDSI